MDVDEFIQQPLNVRLAVIYERVDNLTKRFDERNASLRNMSYVVIAQLLATLGALLIAGIRK